MREILAGIRERGDALIQEWFAKAKTPPTLAQFLLLYWQRMSDPRIRAVVQLVFELYALALRDPRSYPGVLTDPVRYWRTLAARTGRDDLPKLFAPSRHPASSFIRPKPTLNPHSSTRPPQPPAASF
jgi:hypothetical protein